MIKSTIYIELYYTFINRLYDYIIHDKLNLKNRIIHNKQQNIVPAKASLFLYIY
jgi:hypothetical protein